MDSDRQLVKEKALACFREAGIVLTLREKDDLEIVDFGLGDIMSTGLEIVTYVNTERCCAKELVLLPRQTCPEHLHPDIEGSLGKEETFRCRRGIVYLYVQGEATISPHAIVPPGREMFYTVWHEIVLQPGEQFMIYPNMKHWFQGGPEGSIVSEFSTRSRDVYDVFTDPQIKRV